MGKFVEGVMDRAAALGNGVLNLPMDIGKYANLAGNRVNQYVNNIPEATANKRAAEIEATYKNPAYFSNDFNKQRNRVMEAHPGFATAGEIIAGGVGGGGLAKRYVTKRTAEQLPRFIYKQPKLMGGRDAATPMTHAYLGAGGATTGELIKEPLLDAYLGSK